MPITPVMGVRISCDICNKRENTVVTSGNTARNASLTHVGKELALEPAGLLGRRLVRQKLLLFLGLSLENQLSLLQLCHVHDDAYDRLHNGGRGPVTLWCLGECRYESCAEKPVI